MTPEGIDYVELTNHAENDRLPELGNGVDPHLIIGRIKAGHGRVYKDIKETEEKTGHHYRMAIDDHDVTVAFAVEYDMDFGNKKAVVKTVFPSDWAWWDTERFELWDR